jgi:hypothetical protein
MSVMGGQLLDLGSELGDVQHRDLLAGFCDLMIT